MSSVTEIELNINDPILTPEQFAELRHRLRVSQRLLAVMLRVHRRTVESYETPVGKPGHRMVSRASGIKLMQMCRERV